MSADAGPPTLAFVCAMAYGDCLITLSLLERVARKQDWKILGTGTTQRSSQLLRRPLPVIELLADRAGFYSIKEVGVAAACRDFLGLRKGLERNTAPGATLVFDRDDLRTRALRPRGRHALYASAGISAYEDRRRMIESALGEAPDWQPAPAPNAAIRRVTINPCARYSTRLMSVRALDAVLAFGEQRDWQICLLDPCGGYGAYRSRVAEYLPAPALSEAAARVQTAELYLGPDSFFIHLAYYYGVPHFGFFHPDNLHFLTPGMREAGHWCSFEEANDKARLAQRLAGCFN